MVIPEVDAEEAALRDMGIQQDRMENRPVPPEDATQPPEPASTAPKEAAPPVGAEPPDSPEFKPETPPELPDFSPPERDEQGRFKSDQKQQQVDNGQQPVDQPEKPKSRYAQAREKDAKETERKERAWREIQAEKEQVRAERAQWQEARRVEQLRRQAQMPPIQKGGIDLNGYHKAYLDFRQQGDWENAARSLETVLELQQQADTEVQKRKDAQYEMAWRRDMEGVMQKVPDIADPNNPLAREVDRIVQEHPYLFYIPQGFNKAVEIAHLLLAAGSDSELREENLSLRARIEELESGAQPARGGPGRPPSSGPRGIDDMSDKDAENYLRNLGEQEDRMARG